MAQSANSDAAAVTPDAEAAPRGRPSLPYTVVTGGSRGIGFAIAHRFAQQGHNILLVARNGPALEEAARSLRGECPVAVATLSLDVGRIDAAAVIETTLLALGGHAEVLVNNAGLGYCGAFSDAKIDELDELIALNVAAPSRLMLGLLPGMRQRRSGGVVNVASLGGFVPGPYQAAYYASKAYLISLSEAVAAEVRGHGVRVLVVAPGPIATGFHAAMGAEAAWYRRVLPQGSPQSVARWAVLGYNLGVRVVVPGLLLHVAFAALRLLPHVVIVPVMAMLLHPRRALDKGAA